MDSPTSVARSRARRILHNHKYEGYTAQQAEQECRVERQALLTEYYQRTREISRDCTVDNRFIGGQPTALDNTPLNRKQLDWSKNTHGDNLATHISINYALFCRPSAHNATEDYDPITYEIHPTFPDSEIQIPMEPIYINHEATEPPLDHYSRQDVDLALARLEQRMTHYIDTTHEYLATRLDSITSSCANIEKKVDKIDPTTSKLNNGNKRTVDDAFGNFNGACKGLGGALGRLDEAVARLSASTDALAARFGVPRKKDEEADVYEWEKDDCVVKFA